jgi:hypothetical protein
LNLTSHQFGISISLLCPNFSFCRLFIGSKMISDIELYRTVRKYNACRLTNSVQFKIRSSLPVRSMCSIRLNEWNIPFGIIPHPLFISTIVFRYEVFKYLKERCRSSIVRDGFCDIVNVLMPVTFINAYWLKLFIEQLLNSSC